MAPSPECCSVVVLHVLGCCMILGCVVCVATVAVCCSVVVLHVLPAWVLRDTRLCCMCCMCCSVLQCV